jgi:hypothetical protein
MFAGDAAVTSPIGAAKDCTAVVTGTDCAVTVAATDGATVVATRRSDAFLRGEQIGQSLRTQFFQ